MGRSGAEPKWRGDTGLSPPLGPEGRDESGANEAGLSFGLRMWKFLNLFVISQCYRRQKSLAESEQEQQLAGVDWWKQKQRGTVHWSFSGLFMAQ